MVQGKKLFKGNKKKQKVNRHPGRTPKGQPLKPTKNPKRIKQEAIKKKLSSAIGHQIELQIATAYIQDKKQLSVLKPNVQVNAPKRVDSKGAVGSTPRAGKAFKKDGLA